ncbi:unnamed protein product [Rotaria socialis]|uniref:Ion transport domain-containing protein n=1 Tax=Rotaria socialis TaxID=392032 RepID=A0A818DAC3_9BILA|nr:unnamed protein product [Rotaria socialis]CAF3384869.1 unnamed protein product [Rotaria socialis]CAF3439921.1 unnamed protein product [Rotaria socialis]
MIEESNTVWNWQLLRDVFNWGIWKVFGQVAEPYNDAVSGKNEVIFTATGETKCIHKFSALENDTNGTLVFLFAISLTVVSNVLLLNVLIAMFNEKYQNVQDKSNELWRCQRFWLVAEYKEKLVLPPPFNVLGYLIKFMKYLCCKRKSKQFQNDQNEIDKNRERVIAETYWQDVFCEEEWKNM